MKAGSRGESTAIQRLIGRTRFRIRTQWALEGATTATVLAAAAALVAVFAIRAELVGKATGLYLLVGAGAIIVIGAVLAAIRPLDDESVARRIDRASNLADRLSTAIAFRRSLATAGTAPPIFGSATADADGSSRPAEPGEDEHTDLMLAAIRDGERAIPRANVRAAAPFAVPRDWRAALGFLAISALAAGLAIPSIDRTPRLRGVQPPKARPGEVVTLIGDNLLTGIATPLAGAPAADVIGAADVPAEALAPKTVAPRTGAPAMGRGVYLGPSENPFLLEREMQEIAAEFARDPAMKGLSAAMIAGDLDRVTGEVLRLGKELDTEHHKRLAVFAQLATRMSNNRPVEVLEWSADRIRVRVPGDAPYGETTLTAYVGRHTAGPLAFEVLDPKNADNFETGAVMFDPDERAYVERIIAELRMVARRDNVPELEEFANKIEQLLKDAEEGKVSKEKLLEALRKAEEALNQGQEPNQEEIDKQLGDLGKELQKNEVTKELGQALQQQDLEKAKQELEELARKLDPEEKDKALEELQKKLEELQKEAEKEKAELEKKLEELRKQLEDKDKKLTEQQKQELQKQLEEMQKKLAEQQKLTEQQKQELQKKLEEMKKEKPLTEQQKEQLQKQLEKTAQQLQQQQQAQQQKMEQQKQKLEEEIRRLQKERDQAKNDKERLDAERRLEKKKDELKQLQKKEDERNQSAQREAIKRLQKDLEQAAENLQKPQNQQESEHEKEARERQASQKLKDAARETGKVDQDKRKQATQKRIATQMDDLREAMQRAKQKGNKGPQDPFGRKGKNQDFAQRARGQKGSGQAWRPGQGQGQGQQGQQQGGGQGGKQWGTGTGGDMVGDATSKSGNTKDADLEAASAGKNGGSRRETILAAAQKGFASKAYKDVYQKYEEIVEEVMRNEKLPSSYKYYVKRYFAKIHPEAGLDVEISKQPGK